MKKTLLIAIPTIFTSVFCALSLTACGKKEPPPVPLGLEYSLNDDGESYAITGIGKAKYMKTLDIPSTYLEKPVTAIAEGAFYECSVFTKVIIPHGITSIGENAFQSCTSLTSIAIPDTVTFLGDFSFAGCEKLAEINLPDKITAIGSGTFRECRSLTSVTIPDGVTSIERYAFADCEKLASVDLPDSLTTIGNSAFKDCTSLTDITIPDGVTMITSSAFEECSSLKNISLPDSVTFIGGDAFEDTAYYNDENNWSNGVLYIGKHLISADDISGSYEIKEGTLNIAVYAFWDCEKLTEVIIPSSVTTIEDSVFYGSKKLTVITFKGTKEQWNAIKKGNAWDSNMGEYTVQCTDGTIEK